MEVTSRFDFSTLAVEHERNITLMVRIKAPSCSKKTDRRPLNLAVVLDRSGSMSGEKLAYVRDAAIQLVGQLTPQDRLAVVIYDDQVETIVPPQPVTDKAAIRARIGSIRSGGCTNLSGGWLAGLRHVEECARPDAISRVLLLTDGLANAGVIEPARLREIGAGYRQRGITTTAFGFGADFDEDLLTAIADDAGGAFYFIGNPDKAPATFAEEFGELLSVVGQNLTVDFRGRPPAKFISVLNRYAVEPLEDGLRIRVGDLFADEQRELLAAMHIPALREIGPRQVGEITVSLDQVVDPIGHQQIAVPVLVNLVQPDQAQAQPDAEVSQSAGLLRVAEIRDQAIDLIRRQDFDAAAGLISGAAEAMPCASPEVSNELVRLNEELQAAQDRPEYGAKQMAYRRYQQRRGRGEYRKQ